MQKRQDAGFTIVELLIVIVIIAILVALSFALFNNVQARAKSAKISADLAQLEKAIMSARTSSGEVALRYITDSTATAWECVSLPASVNLADKTATPNCWGAYNSALDKISTASGINVRNLTDPSGRPYLIDENEQDGGCNRDVIGAFPQQRTQYDWATEGTVQIAFITLGC